jgi:hypothetical protein
MLFMFNQTFRVHTYTLPIYYLWHLIISTNFHCIPLHDYRLPTPEEIEKYKHIFHTIIDPNVVIFFFVSVSFGIME